jgi:hypothetical protein
LFQSIVSTSQPVARLVSITMPPLYGSLLRLADLDGVHPEDSGKRWQDFTERERWSARS